MIDFGDVFRYREDIYVYLVQSGELTFVAKILTQKETGLLVKMRDRDAKNPLKRVGEKPMFSFVVLTTEDFRECAAHYGNPMMPTDCVPDVIKRLCDSDIEQLRKEIIVDGAANILLKDTITKLSRK